MIAGIFIAGKTLRLINQFLNRWALVNSKQIGMNRKCGKRPVDCHMVVGQERKNGDAEFIHTGYKAIGKTALT